MPTGYTEAIKDNISFKEYARSCMRAFGATIMMRDEPLDKQISKSEILDDDGYYVNKLKKAKRELETFNKLSLDNKKAKFEKHKANEIKRYRTYIKKKTALKKKYEKMLEKVKMFNPPTPDHEDFAEFMKNQILQTIDWDCDTKYDDKYMKEIENLTFREYVSEQKQNLTERVEYYLKERDKINKANDERWSWIEKALEAIDKVE